MSSAFVKFDERLTMELRGNVILEINKADLVENIDTYHEVVEYARTPGYSICIDGITPMWVAHMDLEYMACNYAKLFWTNELAEMSEEDLRDLRRQDQGAGELPLHPGPVQHRDGAAVRAEARHQSCSGEDGRYHPPQGHDGRRRA